jgi:4-hydroxybenzoate polyprenyltransferase
MLKALIKAIRVHQWTKNLLLFLPLILSHRVGEIDALLLCLCGFIAFSFAASSIYIINDIVDVDADRQDPVKSKRPFASGQLSPFIGYLLAMGLLAGAVVIAFTINLQFLAVVMVYAILSVSYSTVFKKIFILDVIILSAFYTLRIIAGSVAIDAAITNWLLAFSSFVFLSLALIKRHSELQGSIAVARERIPGRNYEAMDLPLVSVFGAGSGLMSVLVLLLYINDPLITEKYLTPNWLWGVAVMMLYWIIRIWFLANRGLVQSDPIMFAVRDWPTYVMAFFSLGFIYLAV